MREMNGLSGAVFAGTMSGLVLSFGITGIPRHMSRGVRWMYGILGASVGACIGVLYGVKGKPILL